VVDGKLLVDSVDDKWLCICALGLVIIFVRVEGVVCMASEFDPAVEDTVGAL